MLPLLLLRINGGPFLDIVYTLAALAAVVLLVRRPTQRWLVTAAVAVAGGMALGYLTCWIVSDWLNLFGFALTPITRMWVAFLGAGLTLAAVNLAQRPAWRRAVAAAAVPVIAVACIVGLNVDAGAYQDLAQVMGVPVHKLADEAELPRHVSSARRVTGTDADVDTALPASGKLYSVAIPGTVSHFHARNAEVYLPPAALTRNAPALPVILAFSGQPGAPSDLFEIGHLEVYLNAYARAHDGVTPIVVAPDQLGASGQNPMCVDSPLGNAASYITIDVVNWVNRHLNVEHDPAAWGLLGFSEGATCANQFLAGYPQLFSAELSISSELAPWAGPTTIARAFHGSAAAYAAASPEALMRAGAPFHGKFAEFVVGAKDLRYRPSAVSLSTAARAAGMSTSLLISPGSAHDWNTVRYGLSNGLAPLIEHLGVTA